MHIANIESFKAWLITSIQPICDADPYPLSKYVLALLKKDKDEKELKSICNDQLDVFFQENTLEFVEKLFQVLKDESYLKVSAPAPTPASVTPASTASQSAPSSVSAASSQQQQQQKPQPPPAAAQKRKASTSGDSETAASASNDKQQSQPSESKISRVSAGAKQQQQQPPHAAAQQTPPKDLRSTINARAGNSSAASSTRQQHHQKHQGLQQLTQHQRHPAQVPMVSAQGYQHHGQPPMPFLPPPLPPPPQHQMIQPMPPVSTGPGFYPQQSMPMMLPPQPPLTHQQQRLRCRDFDEKGVCMLGAACPYDHGAHPMTFPPGDPNYGKYFPGIMQPPQSQLPPNQMMSGQGLSTGAMMVTAPSQPISAQPTMVSQQQHQQALHNNRQQQQQQTQLTRSQPADEASQATSTQPQRIVQPPPPLPQAPQQPQSAVVTVVASDPPSTGNNSSNRAFQQQQQSVQSCTLELRKVPASLNNADSLLEHFCKFGTVIDIDVGGCGTPDSAKITFANAADAVAAYRSPEAVLNNRFIRLFLPGGGPRQSAKDRLGNRQQQNRRQSNPRRTSTGGDGSESGDATDAGSAAAADSAGAPPSRASLTWTPHSAEAAAKAAEAAATAAAERKQESARILQAQKVALERAKAHRELRAKQIRMLKDCKESLAKLGNLFAKAKDSESRHSIAETMKPINAQIRDLEASLGVVATGNASLRDLQKELLDLELEIFQKEGLETVTEQKKRLAEVRKLLSARLPQKPMLPVASASSASSTAGPSGGTGGGSTAGGGGGGGGLPNFAQTRLDKRSKSLRIQGQPADKAEDLLRTLASQSGAKAQLHHQLPGAGGGSELLVDFATRAEAEAALAKLKSLAEERGDGLKAEWSQKTAAAAAAEAAPSAAAAE
ncbi:hypothetical protein BOX15_Mlig013727g2 [Macrostomum lignano]|uniref:C3H1-type domain-containing protein n=1 Tax=Macrostomum lignano TaxID=282301 RepID=A0A267DYR2_9PLAT|nr:hypothetical protein BOX15_Mlig013727g2 [Macrostomum lignano]